MSLGKVLVVNSPLFADKRPQYMEDSLPPIGLGYIATNLRSDGYDVELIDAVANNLTIPEILKIITSSKPISIALNIFTTNYILTKAVVEGITDKSIRIIIGGLSTRTLYKDIFAWDTLNCIDVVLGDGELITSALLSGEETEKPIDSDSRRRYFAVVNNSQYFVKDISGISLDRDFFAYEPRIHARGFKEISIITGRGCIFNCAFCAAAHSLNRDIPVREASEDAIILELQAIQEKYSDVTHIRILDDLFLGSSSSIERGARIFARYHFKWRAMAHVQAFRGVSQAKIKELYEGGCREIFVGVESGSPTILRKLHKTHDLTFIRDCLRNTMGAGIGLKTYFIYGLPGETKEDFSQTLAFAKSLREDALRAGVDFRTSVFQFRPYHGTEIYHELLSTGGILQDVKEVAPNTELSSLIGRSQFNFESGNYSLEKPELVHEFIEKTIALSVDAGLKEQ